MNRIDIIIPTRNRLLKLKRALASIPKSAAGVGINVIVVCDNDPGTAQQLKASGVTVILNRSQRGSIFCRNLAIGMTADAIIYATDDLVFLPGSIDVAVESMRKHFPDDDGVVGFKIDQANGRRQCRAGVALVGKKYLDRFPGRRLFFPGYHHFGAQEVARGADSVGKLYFDESAKILHFHPSRHEEEKDETHAEGHAYRKTDLTRSRNRESEGKLWGIIPEDYHDEG